MAKKKSPRRAAANDPSSHSRRSAAVGPDITQPQKTGPKIYLVQLHCPTPLRSKTMEITASDENAARKRFLSHNGINGSDHPLTIEEV